MMESPGPRRSARPRICKSALELLGITPKTEPKEHSETASTNQNSVIRAAVKVKSETVVSSVDQSAGRGSHRKKRSHITEQHVTYGNVECADVNGIQHQSGDGPSVACQNSAPDQQQQTQQSLQPDSISNNTTEEPMEGLESFSLVEVTPNDENLTGTGTNKYESLMKLVASSGLDFQLVAPDSDSANADTTVIVVMPEDGQDLSRVEEEEEDNAEETEESVDRTSLQTLCAPVTSTDIINAEWSRSGCRVKPMKQIVMTTDLQTLLDEMTAQDSMDKHIIFDNGPFVGRRKKRVRMLCRYCDKVLGDRHDFRRHIKTHKDVDYSPYVCPICGYKAQIRAGIARHINIHSQVKPYNCMECGKGFNFKQKLQLHMKYHMDLRDEQCPLCEKAFHEYKTLKTHMWKLHGISNMQEYFAGIGKPRGVRVGKKSRVASVIRQGRARRAKQQGEAEYDEDEDADIDADQVMDSDYAENNQLTQRSESSKNNELVDASNDNELVATSTESSEVADATQSMTLHEIVPSSGEVAETIVVVVPTDVVVEMPHMDLDTMKKEKMESQVNVLPSENATQQTTVRESDKVNAGIETGCQLLPPATDEQNVAPKRVAKRSTLYGTRKTNMYTSRYKMGLHPLKKMVKPTAPATFDPISGKRNRFVNNQRIVQKNQVHPELLNYCTVDSNTETSKVLFQCKLCDHLPFPSNTQFRAHLESVHSEVRAWKCDQCDYRCRLRTSLLVHYRGHRGVKEHVCNLCGKGFVFKQKLKMHLQAHLNLREFGCEQCDCRFNDKNSLNKHVQRVHVADRPFVCTVCSRTYKDKVQLNRHMDVHSAFKKYLCEHCNKYYRTKISLYQHMKSHTCMYHCEICDKSFGSYSGFMAHKVMHDESYEGYVCNICSRVLHTKGSLNRHKTVAHSKLRPYSCLECLKNFKTKKDLKNHLYCHVTEKAFQCEVCNYKCKRQDSLRVHMRRHLPNKPYRCVVCSSEYTQQRALEVHMRKHSNATRFQCEQCHEVFHTQIHFDQHMEEMHTVVSTPLRVATELTVFMCEECSGVFASQDDLAVHILAEHMTTTPATTTTTENTGCVDDVQGEQTIETFVTINDPSSESQQQNVISLLQSFVTAPLVPPQGEETGNEYLIMDNVSPTEQQVALAADDGMLVGVVPFTDGDDGANIAVGTTVEIPVTMADESEDHE